MAQNDTPVFSQREYRWALEAKALPKYRSYLEKKNRSDSEAYQKCRILEQELFDVYLQQKNTRDWFRAQVSVLMPAIDRYLTDTQERIAKARSFDPEYAADLQEEEGPIVEALSQILDFLTQGIEPEDGPAPGTDNAEKINVALLSTALSSYSLWMEVRGIPGHRDALALSREVTQTFFQRDPSAQWFLDHRQLVEPAIDDLMDSCFGTLAADSARQDHRQLRDLITMKRIYAPNADLSRFEAVLEPVGREKNLPVLLKFLEKFCREQLYDYVEALSASRGRGSAAYRRARDLHMAIMGLLEEDLTLELVLRHKEAVVSFLDHAIANPGTADPERACLTTLRSLIIS